ncbi:hypothetical protein EQG49_07035 [Periweissella cryptocerci]|uniref:Uncharacterized protein n=1 Tax=Periweissella cryptocerci TaxID=2506420 RepID=A0A4P6YTX9_9LACO|nr:UPF0158 family protein [Periweissella cryptocerci]QBO36229.1 hypothetical protein EQG49_07035 [Periweissella cryptocerci]
MKNVKLEDVVEHMDLADDEHSAWFNPATGEISFEYDELALPEDEEPWVELPGGDDIDEYGIMQDFIDTLPFSQIAYAQELDDAIQGKGAFRKFKDKVIKLKLDQDWYTFKDAAFTEIAKEWATEYKVPYTE